MKIDRAVDLVRYIRHHLAGSEFQDTLAVEEFVTKHTNELVEAMEAVSLEIPRPRDDMMCHRGICDKETCGRCTRAAKFWAALDKYK